MAKVTFQRKEIEKHIRLDEKALHKITLFGTAVESLSENEIELEILPNRPDLLSMQGFIRAIKAFEGKETGIKKYKINPSKYVVEVSKSVKEIRPHTACAVIKDLKFSDESLKEIISLQERLHATIGRKRKKCAIGIYPLDKISFPIKYEAREPENIKFTPLGYEKEMNAHQILQKHPAGKEYSDLLNKMPRYPIFIDSHKKILSMPPIINSAETGHVVKETTSVFVECSGHSLNTLEKT